MTAVAKRVERIIPALVLLGKVPATDHESCQAVHYSITYITTVVRFISI